jgi:hypothetical protein
LFLRARGWRNYRLAYSHFIPVIGKLFTAIQTYDVSSFAGFLRGKGRVPPRGSERKSGVPVTATE